MKHSTLLPKQITPSTEVLFHELDNEAIMLNLRDGYYYSLNGVGTRLWQLLNEQSAVDSVVDQLLTEYAVDENSLRQDIAELLEQLSALGMVTVTG